MAHGTATGSFKWGGKTFAFKDAPAYAEKNWGGAFPSKWHWVQCNSFDGEPGMSVTAVGARRGLLGLPGIEEDVGMIGLHYRGKFIELVPWNGSVEWDVDPWGRWLLRASNPQYEALLEATCSPSAGTPLRAPTAAQGLAPFCKDTFAGARRARARRRAAAAAASAGAAGAAAAHPVFPAPPPPARNERAAFPSPPSIPNKPRPLPAAAVGAARRPARERDAGRRREQHDGGARGGRRAVVELLAGDGRHEGAAPQPGAAAHRPRSAGQVCAAHPAAAGAVSLRARARARRAILPSLT